MISSFNPAGKFSPSNWLLFPQAFRLKIKNQTVCPRFLRCFSPYRSAPENIHPLFASSPGSPWGTPLPHRRRQPQGNVVPPHKLNVVGAWKNKGCHFAVAACRLKSTCGEIPGFQRNPPIVGSKVLKLIAIATCLRSAAAWLHQRPQVEMILMLRSFAPGSVFVGVEMNVMCQCQWPRSLTFWATKCHSIKVKAGQSLPETNCHTIAIRLWRKFSKGKKNMGSAS